MILINNSSKICLRLNEKLCKLDLNFDYKYGWLIFMLKNCLKSVLQIFFSRVNAYGFQKTLKFS